MFGITPLYFWLIFIIITIFYWIASVIGYNTIRVATLSNGLVTLLATLFFFGIYDLAIRGFQFVIELNKIIYVNINFILGYDGLTICLLGLSILLTIICIISYWHHKYHLSVYMFLMTICIWVFAHVFTVLDLFLFYIIFEIILTPLFILVGMWGSRERKIYASYYLFLYTVLGSLFMMIAFFDIYLHTGNSSLLVKDLICGNFYHKDRLLFVYTFLFLAFAIKIPVVPFHIWLPEAHVEAPTPGSILLAGVILKLGSYGILRFVYQGIEEGGGNLVGYIFTISALGFTFCSLAAFVQQDIKKILAYSSIAHMNMGIMGLFTTEATGIEGYGILLVAHGFVASGLFYMAGMLYDRYKSRLLIYYNGLLSILPKWSWVVFLFVLCNVAMPTTANFIGELLVLYGIRKKVLIAWMIFLWGGLFITLCYSLFAFVRFCYGIIKEPVIRYIADLTRMELYLAYILLAFVFAVGICPAVIYKLLSGALYIYENVEKI